MVVDDRVEVAGPVISRSPLLTDEDLIRVVSGGSTEHQVRVAQRPGIGEGVSQALVNTDAEAAVSALLQNATARIGKDAFSELVERSEAKVNLSQILAARPDIPPSLARRDRKSTRLNSSH